MMTRLPLASAFTLILAACGGSDLAGSRDDLAGSHDGLSMSADSEALPVDRGEADVGQRRLRQASLSPMAIESGLGRGTPFEHAASAVGSLELSWRDCGTTGTRAVQCAELQVPLDYDDLEGEVIVLALYRFLAPSDGPHRGVLLYNPGGPGGSGKDIGRSLAAAGAFDAVAPGFDVIGFDPRGVGDSSALECDSVAAYMRGDTGNASPQDAMLEAASAYGLEGVIDDLTWLAEECRSYWGALFDHMGSNAVVRDMDRIREALGEEKLNFLGMSYGTRLGALYAQEFPERVRAIVLDAPVGPEASFVNQIQGQFDELAVVQEAFFAECESGRISCPPDPRGLFDAYVSAADARGMLSPMLAVWELGLSYSFGLDLLPYLLGQQASQPSSEWMDGEVGILGGDDDGFIQNMNVNCADNAAPLLSIAEADARLDAAVAQNPLFAGALVASVFCNGWTVAPDPVAPLTAPGAPPLLVVGGTHDRRTPPHWARALAGSLESGVLLTSEHWGHTIVGDGSPCVDEAVRSYLVDLELPAAGTVCPAP